jgi:hypothetical protein
MSTLTVDSSRRWIESRTEDARRIINTPETPRPQVGRATGEWRFYGEAHRGTVRFPSVAPVPLGERAPYYGPVFIWESPCDCGHTETAITSRADVPPPADHRPECGDCAVALHNWEASQREREREARIAAELPRISDAEILRLIAEGWSASEIQTILHGRVFGGSKC